DELRAQTRRALGARLARRLDRTRLEAGFTHVVQAPGIGRPEAPRERARHARQPMLRIEREYVDAREPVAIALALDVDELRAVLDPRVLAAGLAQLLVEAE